MGSVETVGEICRKCCSCVRACPTRAVQVRDGRARIIESRCISCGYCVGACAPGIMRSASSLAAARGILAGPVRRFALLSSAYPAAFPDLPPERLVGAVRALGFDAVHEESLGADLVAREYARLYRGLPARDDFMITSTCPAVVQYVEKILPELTPHLAAVVSPMRAAARAVRRAAAAEGVRDARIVFIGPCIAMKAEAGAGADVDAVLTFAELQALFAGASLDPAAARPAAIAPPRGGRGALSSIAGGLLEAVGIDADTRRGTVYEAEGPQRVMDVLQSLARSTRAGRPAAYRLFDLQFCQGCVGGPVMMNDLGVFERTQRVLRYAKFRARGAAGPGRRHRGLLSLDLGTAFQPAAREQRDVPQEEIARILALTGKTSPAEELNCGACGYGSCRAKAAAVFRGEAEAEVCLPFLIAGIQKVTKDLSENQARLIQAEKLASMGQMAAGIAHEINNPLGVVLMYSHLLKDELPPSSKERQDIERIIAEAERTRAIVRGILNFAREEKLQRAPTDINAVVMSAAEAILATSPNGKYRVEFRADPSLGLQMVDAGQLRQVFDNLLKNAVEAMPDGGAVRVTSRRGDGEFVVTVSDTGPGIPPENLPKMLTPFFTTKKVGKGTGLGLSVCYGIVKMHGGTIEASNNAEGGGACFTVRVRQHRPALSAAT